MFETNSLMSRGGRNEYTSLSFSYYTGNGILSFKGRLW